MRIHNSRSRLHDPVAAACSGFRPLAIDGLRNRGLRVEIELLAREHQRRGAQWAESYWPSSRRTAAGNLAQFATEADKVVPALVKALGIPTRKCGSMH